MRLFGNIDTQTFLNEYWQKKPLLIRNAFENMSLAISPEEMAGLALDEEINARLISEKPQWSVKYSPFVEEDFTTLPQSGYSLLLMDLEKHIPWFDELRKHFRFIPDWRFDDIMMSYAPKGSSVGAHIDQYDVFLLQGAGSRHWFIENTPQKQPQWLENCPLRILKTFNPNQDWVLNTGDMLYLPPGLAHHGIAGENCQTISIGFRAQNHAEIISHVTDSLTPLWEQKYYRDGALDASQHPALVSDEAIVHFRNILKQVSTLDDETLKHHVGSLLTERRSDLNSLFPEKIEINEGEIIDLLERGEILEKNLASKFAYSLTDEGVLLHADGASVICSPILKGFIEYLCDESVYTNDKILNYPPEETLPILRSLMIRGCIG